MQTREAGYMVRGRTALLLFGATLALGAVACGSEQASDNVATGNSTETAAPADTESERPTLRIVTAVDDTYFFVPVQQHEFLGTFEGADFDVEVVSGTTPTLGQLLASDEADISLAGATTQAALNNQGIEQTIVASNFSPWGMYVIANDNTDAQSVEELKGANFGITGAGAPSDFSVHKIAQKLGWGPDDYSTTSFGDVGSLVAGLRSGAVDAIIWMADTGLTLEEEGSGRIIGDSAEYVGPTVLEAFSVMDDFAERYPDELCQFFQMYFETVQQLQADPSQFEAALVEAGYSAEVAARLAEAELPRMSDDGRLTDEELEGLSEGAAFSTGDRENENPIDVEYVYWEDAFC